MIDCRFYNGKGTYCWISVRNFCSKLLILVFGDFEKNKNFTGMSSWLSFLETFRSMPLPFLLFVCLACLLTFSYTVYTIWSIFEKYCCVPWASRNGYLILYGSPTQEQFLDNRKTWKKGSKYLNILCHFWRGKKADRKFFEQCSQNKLFSCWNKYTCRKYLQSYLTTLTHLLNLHLTFYWNPGFAWI